MDMDSFLNNFGAAEKPKKTNYKNQKFTRVEEVQVTRAPYLGGDHKFVILSSDGGFCREIWHLWEIYIKKAVHDEYNLPGYKFNLAETSSYKFENSEEKRMIEDLHTYLEFLHHFIFGGDITYVNGKTYHFEAHPGFQAANLPFALYGDRRYTAVWWGKSLSYTSVNGEETLNDGKVRLYRSTSSKTLKSLFKKIKIESGTSAASRDMSKMKSFMDMQFPSRPTKMTRCSYFQASREDMGFDNQWSFVPQDSEVTSEDFETITSLDTVLANVKNIDMVEMGKWAEFFKGFCDKALSEYNPEESTVVKVRKNLDSAKTVVAPTSTKIEIPAEAMAEMKAADTVAPAPVKPVLTPEQTLAIESITKGLIAKKTAGTLTQAMVTEGKAQIEAIKNPKPVDPMSALSDLAADLDPVEVKTIGEVAALSESAAPAVAPASEVVDKKSAEEVTKAEGLDDLDAMWGNI